MTKKSKKPEGLDQFQKLLAPLSKVPKRELDREIEKHKKRAAKRKKKA
jgi:hypothetical protein